MGMKFEKEETKAERVTYRKVSVEVVFAVKSGDEVDM